MSTNDMPPRHTGPGYLPPPGPPVVPGYPSPAETAAAWGNAQSPSEISSGERPWDSPGPAPWGSLHQDIGHTEPRKRGHRGLVIGGAVIGVVLILMLCAVGAQVISATGGTAPAPAATEQAVAAEKPSAEPKKAASPAPVYKIGDTIRGGDFAFTVHSKKCGIAQVGTQYLNKKAQGSFCRLDLSVKNVTRKPHYFVADGMLTATDTEGRTFSVDGEANVYGNQNNGGFINEINPGNQVRAFVYFDVAGGVKLASVTFDAGLFTTAKDVTVPF